MNGDVVNLRRVRKARDKAANAASAAQNRVVFGRTKAERAATVAEAARVSAVLDAHKREPET